MNARERFHAIRQFKPFDRLPILEWAVWWDLTLNRWHAEGLPASLTDRYDLCRHFGQDLYLQHWFPTFRAAPPSRPDEHCFIRDEKDYDRLRPLLFPDPRDMIDPAMWEDWARRQEEGEAVLWFTVEGFFWFPRVLFGIEPHLLAFYRAPRLMHRINEDLAAWTVGLIDALAAHCQPDFMTFAEDMSYNHGPMLSRELFDEFMKPYYHMVVPRLRHHNILPLIDSDGDVTMPLEWFESAGLGGVLPLERQAGVDVSTLRQRHPRMVFVGGFDKMCMWKGEAAMRAEFERLLPAAAKGGLFISCDHQTPPSVSLEDYRLYLRLFREYAERAGQLSRENLPAE